MIKTVTPQELRKAFDAAEWNDYTLIETLPDGSEILVGDIFAAIAAAVQAEQQRVSLAAFRAIDDYANITPNQRMTLQSRVAAAIRARNGAGRE